MIQETVHGVEIFPGVILQQLVVILFQFCQPDDVIVECRRLKLSESLLAQMENSQAGKPGTGNQGSPARSSQPRI